MTDNHDKLTRSYNMSQVKNKNTKPEMIVRRFLHSKGYRFRLYDKKLAGKPDIILKKYRTVIFVNGCFWHGHKNCKYYSIPKTRSDWWENKITKTKKRDIENINELENLGWKVKIVWTCSLKKDKNQFLESFISDLV